MVLIWQGSNSLVCHLNAYEAVPRIKFVGKKTIYQLNLVCNLLASHVVPHIEYKIWEAVFHISAEVGLPLRMNTTTQLIRGLVCMYPDQEAAAMDGCVCPCVKYIYTGPSRTLTFKGKLYPSNCYQLCELHSEQRTFK